MTIYEYLENNLSPKRLEHVLSVVDESEKLCQIYGGNHEKVKTAALFHDMVREMDKAQLNEYIKKYGLDDKYLDNPNVAHGKVAACLMKDEWNIDDEEILNAVSFHTTGRPEMTKTEKIVFIADAIEPKRDYPEVDKLRKATYEDLDKGCLMALTNTIEHLKSKGVNNIDQDTVKAEKWFKEL